MRKWNSIPMHDSLFLLFTAFINNPGGLQGMLRAWLVGFNFYLLHTRWSSFMYNKQHMLISVCLEWDVLEPFPCGPGYASNTHNKAERKGTKECLKEWLSASECTQWNMDSLHISAICFSSAREQFWTPHGEVRLIELCMLLACLGYQGEKIATGSLFAKVKRISH